MKKLLFCLLCFFSLPLLGASGNPTFSCRSDNDLFTLLARNGQHFPRAESPLLAVQKAATGSGVLILADLYPTNTTALGEEVLKLAASKQLRLFIEYPGNVAGLTFDKPRGTVWERTIVTSDTFGAALPAMRILAMHGCQFLPTKADQPLLAIGRVAGFDRAVFGLPKEHFPILFEVPDRKLLVATTKLSSFVTGRYAPTAEWQTVWHHILRKVSGDQTKTFKLAHQPVVAPSFSAEQRLPGNFQRDAIKRGAKWILQSQLLITPQRKGELQEALAAGKETAVIPANSGKEADGALGILEGYASGILHDGTQLQRLPIRADCNAESAVALATQGFVHRDRRSQQVAVNLLDYVYFRSDMCADERADPKHPAFGHIAWGAIAPAWRVANYGDDNARTLQATMLAAAMMNTQRWNDALAKGILANFRTTGKFGFRGDRIDNGPLAQHGWKHFRDAETINYSPHFESGLWACYLWAYRETGYRPFFDKTTNAIAMTMKACPDGWRWGDNNLERARMLLPLAWLIRLEDTPQHRQWLKTVADGLLKHQQTNGAIREWVTGGANSHYHFPASNEAYGTTETPLIQENGDAASDQLYTTGFALLGLHEAVAATGDPQLKTAEERLAQFLCRIQTRSTKYPWLDGWWFRAFDDRRWDYWASSADLGWGAWSLEAGWAQAWTVATLGLRERKTSFWDVSKNPAFNISFAKYRGPMLEQ